MNQFYEIRVRGHLDNRWAALFDGLALAHHENGETVLSGYLADQAALYGVLARIRDLNIVLLSVQRMERKA